MMRSTLLLCVAACASGPAPPPARIPGPIRAPEPERVAVSEPEPCAVGAYLRVRVERSDRSVWSAELDCGARELHITDEPAVVDGEPLHEGSADQVPLAVEQVEAVWAVAERFEWRRWGHCREGGASGEAWRVEVFDGRRGRVVRCVGRLPAAWGKLVRALRYAEREASDAALEEFWPYGGEYWRDELVFRGGVTPSPAAPAAPARPSPGG